MVLLAQLKQAHSESGWISLFTVSKNGNKVTKCDGYCYTAIVLFTVQLIEFMQQQHLRWSGSHTTV